MSDRPEISIFMKWRELCDQLKKEGKEASREEDRGIIAAILAFIDSSPDLLPWRAMCDLLKKAGGKEASQEDLRGILQIYITLMEEVFSGRAHFKVLSIIHGEKEIWKRKELVKSTGISEIKLRSVLGDLVRANMIIYDEEDASVRLIKRLSTLD